MNLGMMMQLDLLSFPESLDHPDYVIIGLHGRDANKHAFFPLVRQLSFPRTRWVLPSAPLVSGPSPDVHRWFSDGDGKRADLANSRQLLHELIDAQIEMGVKAENIFLTGFSQGAVMSLEAGLRYPCRLGGIVALSGYLAFPEDVHREKHPMNARIPLFVAHGRSDEVLPFTIGEETAETLWEWGYPVEFHLYEAAHRITSQEVKDIRVFLHRHMFGLSVDEAEAGERFVVPF